MTKEEKRDCYLKGRSARDAGKDDLMCPYMDTEHVIYWYMGYDQKEFKE